MKDFEQMSDEALVDAIVGGDSEAMDFLMNK